MVSKKQAILLSIGIIIATIIIVTTYAFLTTPTTSIDNIKVEKCGKTYMINYTFTGDGDDIDLAFYKNGTLLSRMDGSADIGENWAIVDFEKDVDIDSIRFIIHDYANHKLVYNEVINDFDIKTVRHIIDPETGRNYK